MKKKEESCCSGVLGQSEKIAGDIYGAAGFAPFKAWLYAYFHPYESCEKQKKSGDFGNSVATFAYIGLVQAVVAIVIMALALALALPIVGLPLTIVGAISLLIIYPIISAVFGLIGSLLYFIIAKLVGGKGAFFEQTYCMALLSGGMALMLLPFNILQIMPLLGWVFGLAGLVVAIYGIVSQYRTIRAVHSLSMLRAIVVLLVPLVIVMAIIIFFIGAAAIAAVGAYGASLPMQ